MSDWVQTGDSECRTQTHSKAAVEKVNLGTVSKKTQQRLGQKTGRMVRTNTGNTGENARHEGTPPSCVGNN